MSSPSAARVRAFDWLRGLAVLFMVECHSLVLLRPELRAGRFFHHLDFVNGLVAPSFIFAAGFSLALVQVRSAAQGARAARVRRTLRRLGEVLAVGTLLNVMWFWYPLKEDLSWLGRVDILQCIAYSLLIALPLFAGLAPHPRLLAKLTALLGLLVFFLSPFAESVRGPLQPLLNEKGHSVFALAPWAGYVYLGAATGALCAAGSRRDAKRWLLGLIAIGAGVWALAPLWQSLYPPHTFGVTDPANHAQRWTIMCVLLLGLLALEERVGERLRATWGMRWVELFGTSSLAAYFFHEALIYYQVFGFSFATRWKDQCSWGFYLLLLAAILALTTVLTWVTDRVYRVVDAKTRRPLPPAVPPLPSPGSG